jgi:NADPH2:quinone reductase
MTTSDLTEMRAAVVRKHGGPEQVRVERVPRPELGAADEVIVRVAACALNRLDLFARRGLSGPGIRGIELPAITGVDVAGVIAEVGAEAGPWRPDDRVVLYPSLSCGRCEACTAGEESMCREYRIFGEDTDGGLAEYCRIPARNLEALPEGVSFVEAAALPAAYTTAWRMLAVAGLRPQDRVLVLGAGGGVGSAAVILSRRLGAYVFAVSRGPEKLARLREIGASRPIDRDEEAVEAVVAAETGGRGVDIVVNPVGGSSWRPAIRSLAMGGRMAICGATIGDAPEISIREIYQSHRQILGAPIGNRRDFRAVLDLLFRGEIRPAIHASLPLERIADAHRLLEEGGAFGKVVMTVG